jgi:twinkle protein
MNLNWSKHDIDIRTVHGGKGFCPKCHHTRKNKTDRSLSVDKVTGMFKCHNHPCDFEGCAMDRTDELIWQKTVQKTYTHPAPKPQQVGDKMLKYFEGRGISNNALLRFNVTESKEWMPGCAPGQAVTTICFNYYRGDSLVNIKYRSADKKFKLEKGAELIFYNLNAAALGDEVVIVEGEIDTLSMWESGVSNVISVPNGASLSKNAKLEYLDNCWRELEHIKKIILAVDNDEAGGFLRDELARRLGAERCWTVNYPEGCKDANEVLVRYGKDGIKALISSAIEIPLEGVSLVEDEMEDVTYIYKHGYPTTVGAGWELDSLVKWRVGEVTTITGTPGSGKSTWLNSLLERLARLHEWPVAMFTPEKTPTSLLITELASIHVGEPFYRANPADKMSVDNIKRALNFLNTYFYFLRRDEVSKTVAGLIKKAIECVKRYGIKAFVLDPWNYIDHDKGGKDMETNSIKVALSELADFAKRYQVHVFIVAHPAKMRKDPGSKKMPVPTLSDISGSAHFWNMTDNGITVYRNRTDGTTEIHVQKIRWWFVGKEGMHVMHFEKKSQRFLDSPPDTTPYTSPENFPDDGSPIF